MSQAGPSVGHPGPAQAAGERVIDLQHDSVRELNALLHRAELERTHVQVLHPDGRHSLAVGIDGDLEATIEGHVGYYCAAMNKRATVRIRGNAGTGLAENLISGEVILDGDASQAAGATARGGRLLIRGNAAARCGISMKGADIVVGGSIGHAGAFMAQRGRLVVLGDAGAGLGDSIYEASVFVRGSVESLGADCQPASMTDADTRQLGELLIEAGLGDVDPGDFSRYESARQLYNFDVDNAGMY